MTSDQRIALISAIGPIVVVILGGIGWVIRQAVINAKEPPASGVEVAQGQVVTAAAIPNYLIGSLDSYQARARVYRDALVRAGIDPDDLLREAGLTPLAKTLDEEATSDT